MCKHNFNKKNERENPDEWDESGLYPLIAYFARLPKPTVTVLNPARYRQMLSAAAALRLLLEESVAGGKIKISLDPGFHLGAVSAELSDLTVMHPNRFSALVLTADNFEIYPLTNGNIRLALAFYGVTTTIC